MELNYQPKKALMAARASYFVSGFAISTWAPMIPYVKEKLHLTPEALGLLLLCLGLAAFICMPFNHFFIGRWGCRGALRLSSTFLMVDLFLLPILPSLPFYVVALLFFGMAFGITDVSMNLNAMVLERETKHRIMSQVNAFYSIGCLVGAALFSFLAHVGLPVHFISWIHDGIMVCLVLATFSHLLSFRGEKKKQSLFAFPKGAVILLGCMAFITYLAEGSILDWAGVILSSEKGASFSEASLGFAIFSASMLVLRLCGDYIITYIGEKKGIVIGSVITILGYVGVDLSSSILSSLFFFAFMGAGLANIVPALCSLLTRQKDMPLDGAVTAFNTMGYSGVLVGPAILGFIGQHAGLPAIFMFMAILLALQTLVAMVKLK